MINKPKYLSQPVLEYFFWKKKSLSGQWTDSEIASLRNKYEFEQIMELSFPLNNGNWVNALERSINYSFPKSIKESLIFIGTYVFLFYNEGFNWADNCFKHNRDKILEVAKGKNKFYETTYDVIDASGKMKGEIFDETISFIFEGNILGFDGEDVYKFVYFNNNEGDDPPIYVAHDGASQKIANSFSEWLEKRFTQGCLVPFIPNLI